MTGRGQGDDIGARRPRGRPKKTLVPCTSTMPSATGTPSTTIPTTLAPLQTTHIPSSTTLPATFETTSTMGNPPPLPLHPYMYHQMPTYPSFTQPPFSVPTYPIPNPTHSPNPSFSHSPTPTPILTPTPIPTPILTPTPTLTPTGSDVGASSVASNTTGKTLLEWDGHTGWLPYSEASKFLTETLKKFHDDAYETFHDFPTERKEDMFNYWTSKYIIPDSHREPLFNAFKTRAGKRLRQMYLEIRAGAKADWKVEPNLRKLDVYWHSEKFIKKSTSAKAPRASTKGGSLHTECSAIIESTRHMMDDYEDRLRDARQRQMQQAEDQGIPVTDLPPIDEEEIWKETVGGAYKGRIYGMGLHLSSRSVTGGASSSIGAMVDSRVDELERKLAEQECRHQQERREHEEELRRLQEDLRIQREQMQRVEQRIMSAMQSYVMQMRSAGDQLPMPSMPLMPSIQPVPPVTQPPVDHH